MKFCSIKYPPSFAIQVHNPGSPSTVASRKTFVTIVPSAFLQANATPLVEISSMHQAGSAPLLSHRGRQEVHDSLSLHGRGGLDQRASIHAAVRATCRSASGEAEGEAQ